jgi:hypothetical protein
MGGEASTHSSTDAAFGCPPVSIQTPPFDDRTERIL